MINWTLGLLMGLGIASLIEGHHWGLYFLIGCAVLITIKEAFWMEMFK